MGTNSERSLHLLISGPFHDRLRWIANRDETTIAEVVRRALLELIQKRVPTGAVLPPITRRKRTKRRK